MEHSPRETPVITHRFISLFIKVQVTPVSRRKLKSEKEKRRLYIKQLYKTYRTKISALLIVVLLSYLFFILEERGWWTSREKLKLGTKRHLEELKKNVQQKREQTFLLFIINCSSFLFYLIEILINRGRLKSGKRRIAIEANRKARVTKMRTDIAYYYLFLFLFLML